MLKDHLLINSLLHPNIYYCDISKIIHIIVHPLRSSPRINLKWHPQMSRKHPIMSPDSRSDADQIRLYLKTLLLICPFPFTSFCSLNQFLPCSTFNSNFTTHITLANKNKQNQKHRMPNKNSNYSKENHDRTSVSDLMNM